MSNEVLARAFVAEVSALRFENVFNPYSDVCPIHDKDDADVVRAENLISVLTAAIDGGVHSIWIARDIGHRGGRRTGLPLTDESNLTNHAKLLGSRLLRKATRTPIVTETTARVVWERLLLVDRRVFLWNIFPLHPHNSEDSLSNRHHNRLERVACAHLILWLIAHLRPTQIVAIGGDAAKALERQKLSFKSVRHPSFGGQSEFRRGVSRIYNMPR
jgi:uracil-DNA glycosylase